MELPRNYQPTNNKYKMKKGEKVISITDRMKKYKVFQDDNFIFEQVRKKCCKCGNLVTFSVTSKKGLSLAEWQRFWINNPNFGLKDDAISPENIYFHGRCYDDWV